MLLFLLACSAAEDVTASPTTTTTPTDTSTTVTTEPTPSPTATDTGEPIDTGTPTPTGDTGAELEPCTGASPTHWQGAPQVFSTPTQVNAGSATGPGRICSWTCDRSWLVPSLAPQAGNCPGAVATPADMGSGDVLDLCVQVLDVGQPDEQGFCLLELPAETVTVGFGWRR